jgi:hypothetical protein
MTYAIEAEGLVKHFGETKALQGVDLAARQGTVHAVLGPNGAGKPNIGQRHFSFRPQRREGARYLIATFMVAGVPVSLPPVGIWPAEANMADGVSHVSASGRSRVTRAVAMGRAGRGRCSGPRR